MVVGATALVALAALVVVSFRTESRKPATIPDATPGLTAVSPPDAAPAVLDAAPRPVDAAPTAAQPDVAQSPPPRRSRRARTKPRPAEIKVRLVPRRAVYDVGDVARLEARVFDGKGRAVQRSVKWRLVGDFGRLEGARVRFVRAGRGQVRACIGTTCGEVNVLAVKPVVP